MDGQKKKSKKELNNNFDYLVYQGSEKEAAKIQTIIKDESVWLSRKSLAELFSCSTDNIAFHLKKIFKSGELTENSVAEQFSATAADGKVYKTYFYNLDAIISVGYRINSKRATEFRMWASKIIREYIVRGAVVDKKRMQRDMEYARLVERAEMLRITEQELRKQITQISKEYRAAKKKAREIGREIKNPKEDSINYGELMRKSMSSEWWDKMGGAVSDFFEHLEKLTENGAELYDYIEDLSKKTPFRPLISDFVGDTTKLIEMKKKHKA